MNIDQLRTIAETLNAGKPDVRSAAYTLWLQTVSTFLRFAEEDNDSVDIDRLEAICTGDPQ